MLKLDKITKDYQVADQKVQALKGINLCFRKNEFVSILGPSGCGKTTLLNIIGGLDKYTSGDLGINGVSTKEFKDRDWDVYRNHRIGFIFQSYNLIPHQTILGNVELALTISGVSKAERTRRAKEALDKVGLKDQYKKKQNQLSGGQCQRVAIARALVNEPEILLADEPTGALDTETSIQIMELIKEIAKDRLVIMVTHNPDLAYQYSNRIIKLLDGKVIDDSNPFSFEDEAAEIKALKAADIEQEKEEISKIEAEYALSEEDQKDKEKVIANNRKKEAAVKKYKNEKASKEKAKMSWFTSLMLSAKNLWSKRKRTIMVGVAGSIGIIGIASVLAVSTGVRDYIDNLQEDMLSGNPISIEKTAYDYSLLLGDASMSEIKKATQKEGLVNTRQILDFLISNKDILESLVHTNNISKDYVDYVKSMPKEYYSDIKLNYGIDITKSLFTEFNTVSDDFAAYDNNGNKDEARTASIKADLEHLNGYISLQAINSAYANAITYIVKDEKKNEYKYEKYSDVITGISNPVTQSLTNNDYILEQYDLVAGNMPSKATDLLVVLNSDQSLNDLALAQLGYYAESQFYDLVEKSLAPDYQAKPKLSFTFDEIMNKSFTWYPNNVIYKQDESTTKYRYRQDQLGDVEVLPASTDLKSFNIEDISPNKGVELKISGIVKLKKNVSYGSLKSGILYQEDFARYITLANSNSNIGQLARIITEMTLEQINAILAEMGQEPLDEDKFNMFKAMLKEGGVVSTLNFDWDQTLTAGTELPDGYFTLEPGTKGVYIKVEPGTIAEADTKYYKATYSGITYDFEYAWLRFEDEKLVDYRVDKTLLPLKPSTDIGTAMMNFFGGGGTSTNSNMYNISSSALGLQQTPTSIYVYPTDFSYKDKVTSYLDKWNEEEKVTVNEYNSFYEATGETREVTPDTENNGEVQYTDSVGLIISLINTMINIITYALIAFTALSLVVSCVMIAIITYVSVMERVKEIGVIRSLGGRKKDVSHLFNAETFIIGLVSGIIGIAVTGILALIANIIVTQASDGAVTVIANLNWKIILSMILLSLILTVLSGLIPSRSAARQDPVNALRSE